MDLIPSIENDGQPEVDIPVAPEKAERLYDIAPSIVGAAVANALGGKPPMPIQVSVMRQQLRWMKPDGNGGVIPR